MRQTLFLPQNCRQTFTIYPQAYHNAVSEGENLTGLKTEQI